MGSQPDTDRRRTRAATEFPIIDTTARFRSVLLLSGAQTAQQSDHRIAQAQEAWTDHSALDGIPTPNAVPAHAPPRTAAPVCPLIRLSHVVEVPETRNALHHDIFAGMAHAQLLLRIGWQETGRATHLPSPRQPLGDVLLS